MSKRDDDSHSIQPGRATMLGAYEAESMLHYTTIQFGLPSTDTTDIGRVDNVEAAMTLIRLVDWRNDVGAWHETQEGPLPAIIFQNPAAKAELYVSHVPMDAAPTIRCSSCRLKRPDGSAHGRSQSQQRCILTHCSHNAWPTEKPSAGSCLRNVCATRG